MIPNFNFSMCTYKEMLEIQNIVNKEVEKKAKTKKNESLSKIALSIQEYLDEFNGFYLETEEEEDIFIQSNVKVSYDDPGNDYPTITIIRK